MSDNVTISSSLRDRIVERIVKDAVHDGFQDIEIREFSLKGFEKRTSSPRILHLCKVAFYRGCGRGIKSAHEATQPVELRTVAFVPDRQGMSLEQRAKLLWRVEGYAVRAGVTEDELGNWTMDGFQHYTKSPRILRLCKLAYYRGWCRGVQMAYGLTQEVVFDD